MVVGKSFYTIAALSGFLAGVLGYLVIQPPVPMLLADSGLFILFIFFFYYHPNPSCSRRGLFLLVLLFLIGVCLGLLRGTLSEHHVTPDQIDSLNGQKITFEGLITETDVRRDATKYTVGYLSFRPERGAPLLSFRGSAATEKSADFSQEPALSEVEGLEMTNTHPVNGLVLVTLPKYPAYAYGDRLRVTGDLQAPGKIEDFDYGHYLSRYGIYSVMYSPRVKLLASGQGNPFWVAMSWLYNSFLERVNLLWPEPHASFEAGLLIGARKGIPPDLTDKFNVTGLSHIIAISGFNITIIIVCVMAMLRRLPRKTGFVIAVAVIILFTLFVGASPSVVRASIMGILGLIALNSGRQNSVTITILFTAFFMVLANPKILWWDVGFQLSFTAVLGVIYVSPHFKKLAEKLPETLGIREAILMTVSAQVMSLPIILYNFGRLSLISPLANLLVGFAVPPAMLTGFIAVVLSLFSPPLGLFAGYFCWAILSYILTITQWLAAVPFASLNIAGIGACVMVVYYALLAGFLIRKNNIDIVNK